MKRASRSTKKRLISVVTGTRAEYGLLRSVIAAIHAHPRLELQLIACGMHLLPEFGHTVDEIVADGWPIARQFRMQLGDDSFGDQAFGLARGIVGLTKFFEKSTPDVVVVLGDRIEAMAGALAGVTTGRLVAHIHGGDIAQGDFDESLRHAITKLANIHLPATKSSARRIARMGEDPESIHIVGAPGLDRIREILDERSRQRDGKSVTHRSPVHRQSSVPHPSAALQDGAPNPLGSIQSAWCGRPARSCPYALIVQHASGRPAATERRVTQNILRAAQVAGLRREIIFPNTDRGFRGVLQAITAHERRHPNEVRIHRSLPRDDYMRALIDADVLLGNSSSGIIEAPFVATPSVNVGPRQAGREPGGSSIQQCGETFNEIQAALDAALNRRARRRANSVYGDGHAGERIAAILARLRITPESRRKVQKRGSSPVRELL